MLLMTDRKPKNNRVSGKVVNCLRYLNTRGQSSPTQEIAQPEQTHP